MKKSEYISCFLDFMRESTMEYEVARSRQSDADNETQDLLHRLELHDDRLILFFFGLLVTLYLLIFCHIALLWKTM